MVRWRGGRVEVARWWKWRRRGLRSCNTAALRSCASWLAGKVVEVVQRRGGGGGEVVKAHRGVHAREDAQ